MTIKVEILGVVQVQARLQDAVTRVRSELRTAIAREAGELRAYVVRQKLSGQVLHRRTGNLASSINDRLQEGDTEISATVGTNVFYGRYHELGGTFKVPAHTRTSKLGKSYPVAPYSVTFPQRSFLRSSLNDMSTKIRADIARAVQRGVRAA